MKNKWILIGVAIGLITINLLNADFSAYKQLSAGDLLPVIFMVKTGVLSAVLIGLKKLWEKIRRNNH